LLPKLGIRPKHFWDIPSYAPLQHYRYCRAPFIPQPLMAQLKIGEACNSVSEVMQIMTLLIRVNETQFGET
jgi:hypothetical protein